MQYFWVATTGPSFTDKTGLWQHSLSLTVRKSDTVEAGKWFIEDALVAPWSTQKDIGEIEKRGNQIITLGFLCLRIAQESG